MANTLTAPKWVQDTWPPPNFVDPETRGRSLEYVSIAFSVFGLVVVLLRCFSRIYLTRAFGLDDVLIIIALLLCIALAVLLIIGIEQWYLGYHIWDLPAQMVIDHRHGMWIASYINLCCSCLTRISILLFYRRLSVSFTRGFLIASWIGIAYNICLILAFSLDNTFICSPTKAFWLRYDLTWRASHKWKCGNEAISLPAWGVSTIVADIYCTVLPLVLIVTLKIPRRQKVALYFLFGIGFLACGAAIARVTFLWWTVARTWDFTWRIYDMWVWNMVELFLGIFAASAPALKPLSRRIVGSRFLGTYYTYYTYGTQHSRAGEVGNNVTNNADVQQSPIVYRGSERWNSPSGHWKEPQHITTSISKDDELHAVSKESGIARSASVISTKSSLNHDQVSVESFPPRRSRFSRGIMPGSPITEEPLSPSFGVDPPKSPAAVKLKAKPSHESPFLGHRLPSQDTTLVSNADQPKPIYTNQNDNIQSVDYSPIPLPNQYLTNHGWVELKPVRKVGHRRSAESKPGSVKAARLRAEVQNESGLLQPSPTESQKPYYDAESSHHAAFIPTPLPKPVHDARPSNDLTRLDYSDNSGRSSTQDFGQFQLNIETKSGSTITALPQQRRR